MALKRFSGRKNLAIDLGLSALIGLLVSYTTPTERYGLIILDIAAVVGHFIGGAMGSFFLFSFGLGGRNTFSRMNL